MQIKRYAIILITLCYIALNVTAQKQPQIQEGGVLAPANVKIDGKLNEWPNPFINPQKYKGFLNAFNSSSRIYYTVANDDKNLYLIVRGLGNGVTKKILAGGLTFTISHAADKKNRGKDPSNVAIKFPVPLDPKIIAGVMSQINQIQDFLDDSVANRKIIDTLDNNALQIASNGIKEIHVWGVKDIPDSVLSLYNTEGIKASLRFIQVQAAIEIAIPLKYLGLSVINPITFSYNIRIDAVPPAARVNATIDPNAPMPIVETVQFGVGPVTNPNNGYAWNPTDFWGEYVLVNK